MGGCGLLNVIYYYARAFVLQRQQRVEWEAAAQDEQRSYPLRFQQLRSAVFALYKECCGHHLTSREKCSATRTSVDKQE